MPVSKLVAFCLITQVASVDFTKVGLNVMGQSGKFTIFAKDMGEGKDPNKVMVTMDYLHELDKDGNIIGNTGNPKHSIETFASQEFNLTGPEPVTDPKAQKTTFVTEIGSKSDVVGKLKVETLILEVGQNVGPTGDKWAASGGDLKWNIMFNDWEFLTGSKEGMFVELGIEVKGKAAAGSGADAPAAGTKDLGGGVKLELTNKITLDGSDTDMPAGYPKEITKNSKRLLVFRFPRFNSSVVYDPLIRISESDSFESPVSHAFLGAQQGGLVVLVVMALGTFRP